VSGLISAPQRNPGVRSVFSQDVVDHLDEPKTAHVVVIGAGYAPESLAPGAPYRSRAMILVATPGPACFQNSSALDLVLGDFAANDTTQG
jgi:hypothetical protein